MTTAKDALAALGISPEETTAIEEEMKNQSRRDPRICMCGHPMSRHSTDAGVGLCSLPKSTCNCKFPTPALKVGDTRLFLRSTTGPGAEHALTRGIIALALAGKEAEWLVPVECNKCKTTDGKIIPVPLTDAMTVAYDSANRNFLLCEECMLGLR